jgi:DNA polymerase-3 subunit gamma/tau
VVDATALRAVWPEVLEVVKQTNRTTRALLDNAQVAGLSSDVVTLSAVSAPLARMLGEDRNTSILSAALASVLGGKWKVVVETGPPGGAAASAAAPPSPPTTDWSGSSGASTPTAESAAPSGYQPAAPDDIPDDPRDISEPDDPDAGASKVDPETDALRLLQDTLGARPLDA